MLPLTSMLPPSGGQIDFAVFFSATPWAADQSALLTTAEARALDTIAAIDTRPPSASNWPLFLRVGGAVSAR